MYKQTKQTIYIKKNKNKQNSSQSFGQFGDSEIFVHIGGKLNVAVNVRFTLPFCCFLMYSQQYSPRKVENG